MSFADSWTLASKSLIEFKNLYVEHRGELDLKAEIKDFKKEGKIEKRLVLKNKDVVIGKVLTFVTEEDDKKQLWTNNRSFKFILDKLKKPESEESTVEYTDLELAELLGDLSTEDA